MEQRRFPPGSIVRLRSGGPAMTVMENTGVSLGNPRVFCQWFGGTKLNQGSFDEESLEADEADDEG
jgi:uncharacterized protein YodC (DUF2158 family)